MEERDKPARHPYKAFFLLEVWAKLKMIAEAEDRSINWVLNQLVNEGYAHREKMLLDQKGSKGKRGKRVIDEKSSEEEGKEE